MGHFAKVLDGKVLEVIKAEPEYIDSLGDTSPYRYIQTSYNTWGNVHYAPNSTTPDGGVALRGNYAGTGMIYDEENDVFRSERPLDRNGVICASWTLNSNTWIWDPPTPKPLGDLTFWDEVLQQWI